MPTGFLELWHTPLSSVVFFTKKFPTNY